MGKTRGVERAARAGVDAYLRLSGYRGSEIDDARVRTLEWARLRARALRSRRGVVAGTAVLVTSPGRVRLVPIERLLAGPDETTVELLTTAVSPGTERAQWLRLPNARPAFPYHPGYSGVGRVLRAGRSGSALAPGTLVAVPRVPHASVATVPTSWVVPVPGGVSDAAAALVYLAIIAGYGVDRSGLESGQSTCVLGAGTIGSLAVRIAGLRTDGQLTVVGRSRRGAAAAELAGARFHTVDEGLSVVAADVVIDATGDPAGIHGAIEAAALGGTVVLLGSPRGVTHGFPVEELRRKRLRIVGAHISALATQAASLSDDPFRALADEYLGGLAAGSVVVDDLIGETIDPREIDVGYRRLARGELAAAQLDWRRLPTSDRLALRRSVALPKLRDTSAAVVPAPAAHRSAGTARARFAVVGCGDIGLANARAVAAAANAELVLCHDVEMALARAAADDLGAMATTSLDEVFDADRIDAVLLAVPHDLHAPLIERAAAAGQHVLVEKPLAVDHPSALRAAAAMAAAQRSLSVCFPYRYEPGARAARALVEAGALGAVRGFTITSHADKPDAYWAGGFSGRSASDWRTRRDRAGGGVLIMNLTHHLDLLRFVAGVEPVAVTAMATAGPGQEVEEVISVAVELAGGAVGSVVGSSSSSGDLPSRFEVWGTDGAVRLEPEPAVFTRRVIDDAAPRVWRPLPADDEGEPAARREMVERFADAVLGGFEPDVGVGDALAVQAFVAAAYRSIETGARVELASFGAQP